MRTQREEIYVADFETTVYDGQEQTDVWAAAIVKLYTEDVQIFHSIDELFDFLLSKSVNTIVYFHNLKFDGEFWLSFLLTHTDYKPCFIQPDEDTNTGRFVDRRYMKSGEFRYSISDKGMWYTILIKHSNYFIELRDSLKLLPISVEKMGKSFGTKHKKLSMEYEGYRYPGCQITDAEKEYISNDVLVVKEAVEIMYNQGHKQLTIGSCCLSEYKAICPFLDYNKAFPNLYEFPMDKETFGYSTIGDYIRASYRGGWCYVVDEKKNRKFKHGTTADVNSLYPSMMHGESGNRFPIGMPTFWIGDEIPDEALQPDKYFFIRMKFQFKLKKGFLPHIQIKHSPFYQSTVCLKTSDILSRIDGKYHSTIEDMDGNILPATVTMVMTMTDYYLVKDHYHIYNAEILDGCYFSTRIGLFDEYIDKYKEIKMSSKGATREIAKLFLNNLYGKFATSTDSSFKVARLTEDGSLSYRAVTENDKKPGYIPIGTAITSYARNFTIRAAQKNYHGITKPGFIYADTDSIHCDLLPEQIEGIRVDDNAFCCWKLESCWDEAVFVRQKCYAEHITHENQQPISDPYWELKCAGMPDNCKNLFLLSMNPETKRIVSDPDFYAFLSTDYTKEELQFLRKTRTIRDFKIGLQVPGKLLPTHIKGGVLLTPTLYTMRKDVRL